MFVSSRKFLLELFVRNDVIMAYDSIRNNLITTRLSNLVAIYTNNVIRTSRCVIVTAYFTG